MSSARRDASLRGLCGLAVIAVVTDEVGASSGRTVDDDLVGALLGRLDAALAILIVAAAFWLYRPFTEHGRSAQPGVVTFWWRNVVLWVPTLWVVIAVTFVFTERAETGPEWLRHMALVQPASFYWLHLDLAHLWVVSVLAGFVVVTPIVGRVSNRRHDRQSAITGHVVTAGALAAVSYAFVWFAHHEHIRRPVSQWVLGYLDWFALGILLAAAVSRPGRTTRLGRTVSAWAGSPATCWSAALALWALSATPLASAPDFSPVSFWQRTLQHAVSGLVATFAVLPCIAHPAGAGARHFTRRVPQFLGSVAFGTLLWGLPVLAVVRDVLDLSPFGGGFGRTLVLTVFLSLACGVVTRNVVDRPIRRWFGASVSVLPSPDSRPEDPGGRATASHPGADPDPTAAPHTTAPPPVGTSLGSQVRQPD